MSLAEYSRRMNRVLDHIDQHLDAPLELDELARLAHFSPYHFHRVFSAWLGETLGEYLQRRRLSVAAMHLAARPDTAVLEVALAVGFGSGEAFARAFKRHFGCTPTAWKSGAPRRWAEELQNIRNRRAAQQRKLDQHDSNPDQASALQLIDHDPSEQATSAQQLKVRMLDFPATRVAYLRKIGPYGPAVGKFLSEEFTPWKRAHGLQTHAWYGVPRDDPSITAPSKCRFDCCVEVPPDFQARGQASIATLPGGRYAAASFTGDSAAIVDAWTELFRDWLPASGMQCDARPFFDYFPNEGRVDPQTGAFDCSLCIPVCPL